MAAKTVIAQSLAAAILLVGLHGAALAQDQSGPTPAAPEPPTATPAPATTTAPAAPAPDAVAKPFTQDQLKTLLAPIALYSDSLLAQILPASAYPVDIIDASRWLEKNQQAATAGNYATADSQKWDPSVKALLRFPTVLQKMSTELDWTRDLGDAFVAQPDDVAAAIQALRQEAQSAGSLKSSKAQAVSTESQGGRNVVVIRDADPGVVYVPTYDPVAVYQSGNPAAAALIGFGLGIATAAIISNNYWNWNYGWAYPGRWAGYPGYRRYNNVVIRNTDINVINNRWRPNPNRFRPSNRVQQAITRQGGTIRNGRLATLPRANVTRPVRNAGVRKAGIRNPAVRQGRAVRGGPAFRGGGPRFNRGARPGGPRHAPRRVGRRR
ncbi:hypothetical protein LMIY3S_05603 [Labrys miyagiensis]